MTTRLSAAPALGGTAMVTVTVVSAVTSPAVTVTAELSPDLRWVSAPAGTTVTDRPSAAPHLAGRVSAARQVRPVTAGQRLRYVGVVRAVGTGPAQVVATVTGSATRTAGGRDTAFVTVGRTPAASRPGIEAVARSGAVPYRGPRSRPAPPGPRKPVGSLPVRTTGAAAPASPFGTACVRGTWNYLDAGGVGHPAAQWVVEVWDQDPGGTDDLLASGGTGFDGEYELCFANGDGFGGQDPYVRFVADNGAWRVQNYRGEAYAYVSGVVADGITDGTTADVGWLQPGDPTHMRGAAAYAATQRMWNGIPGACWDMTGDDCRPVIVNWEPGWTEWPNYDLGSDQVRLGADDPNSPMLVAHEVSHAIMDDVYEDQMPPTPSCDPHFVPLASSAGCAWVEGFAEWLPAYVFQDPHYRWADGSALNLETPDANTPGWDDGDTVEGRVAGALIDLSDPPNEVFDLAGEGIEPIWTTFQRHRSTTFREFMQHRAAEGFAHDPTVTWTLARNTVGHVLA